MNEEQIQTDVNEELLTELDGLEVVEAAELQDGAAFHAFRFAV